MTTDLPTGSITGRGGWEWNRWQNQQPPRGVSTESASHRSYGHVESERQPGRPEQEGALQCDHRRLQTQLEQKERRLEFVIDHYERLLADRNRQLANQRRAEPADDGLPVVFSKVLQWMTDR